MESNYNDLIILHVFILLNCFELRGLAPNHRMPRALYDDDFERLYDKLSKKEIIKITPDTTPDTDSVQSFTIPVLYYWKLFRTTNQ